MQIRYRLSNGFKYFNLILIILNLSIWFKDVTLTGTFLSLDFGYKKQTNMFFVFCVYLCVNNSDWPSPWVSIPSFPTCTLEIKLLKLKTQIGLSEELRNSWQYLLQRSKTPPHKRGVQDVTLNCMWWWGSSSASLENVAYLFIIITPRSTLISSSSTC